MNILGIYSVNISQGLIRPTGNKHLPVINVIQHTENGISGKINTGIINPPVPLISLSTTTSIPQVIPASTGTTFLSAMTLTSPISSNFRAVFTATYSIISPQINITGARAASATALSVQLAGLTPTGALGAVLGLGQVITPGIYDIVTPAAIQGTLTLNGLGEPNALFVIRINGALTSVAASQVVLINGASPANVFWISQGATALGANTTFQGTALAVGGASSIGNSSVVIGRLLSTSNAVTTDTSTITSPGATTTPIALGSLQTFTLFTANGAVANTGASIITGDIGTNAGAISGYGLPTVVHGNIYLPGSLVGGPVSANFGIYKNSILIPASLVNVSSPVSITSATVATSAIVGLTTGDVVTAKATAILGTLTVFTRTLSLQQV